MTTFLAQIVHHLPLGLQFVVAVVLDEAGPALLHGRVLSLCLPGALVRVGGEDGLPVAPGPPGSIYSVAPPILVQNSHGKKGTVNSRSYLSKLVNFPFLGSSKSPSPGSIYGKNNNIPPPHQYEDQSGRSFYL